jgi:uncharacterized protein with HEPN domain
LGDIETNDSSKWKDLAEVKEKLWKMLFAVNAKTKNIMQQKLNNLAQTSNSEVVKT